MNVTIKFSTGNAAFEDNFEPQLAHALGQAAIHVADSMRLFEIGTAHSSVESALLDLNGNSIGKVRVEL